jgi:type III restriction enzyme
MAVTTLKPFQDRAIESGVAVFDHARILLDAAGDDGNSRATAIHNNGYLLIEAPTGAGKTLMAGNIVERISARDRIVWFWFAPFKGVVDQSANFLREQFQGLRLRTLSDDRTPVGTRSGDVFVTTWQLVSRKLDDRRSVRKPGELNPSVDELAQSLREQGFRLGVVVDEAHHGFHADTKAAAFFRTVLMPEYTILVTATPDDADLRDLQERMQVTNIHRISVSRADAVGPGPGAGLIKNGIKCIAWRAEEGNEGLVDFEATALREGAALHRFLKGELQRAGVNLTPLMLVQVDSKAKSVEVAKEKLVGLGFNESQIAIHTSEEPDAGLLALANDESREVLIFKMSVALGFDAPRAWSLVSMRAARDEDFGVQLVGRILRVHRRLQGKVLPDPLKYGYVLLADIEAQGGLDAAGQRMNLIQTAYATVSPTTVITQIGERTFVQSVGLDGQTTFLPAPPAGAIFTPPPAVEAGAGGQWDPNQSLLFAAASAPEEVRDAVRIALSIPPQAGRFKYDLRPDVPRRFKSQEIWEDRDVTEEQCAEMFFVSAHQMLEAVMNHERVRVQKLTLEIFTHVIQSELGFAPPSLEQMQRKAQAELLRSGYFSAKALRQALMRRLQATLADKLLEAEVNNSERISGYLDVLLSQHPELLRDAQKAAIAAAADVRDADDLPNPIESDHPLPPSRLNVYRVQPSGLNSWERGFADYLDGDDTGTVLWWHRNPPRKAWSINVLLESGQGFYPDFILGIKERPREHGGLLTDTKYAFEVASEVPKILADHKAYGRVLILSKNTAARWTIVHVDPQSGSARLGIPFRIADAARY